MKSLLLLVSISFLTGCVTFPVNYPEQTGSACVQTTDEQVANKEYSCLRVQSYRDSTKWHRVKSWEYLGDIPSN